MSEKPLVTLTTNRTATSFPCPRSSLLPPFFSQIMVFSASPSFWPQPHSSTHFSLFDPPPFFTASFNFRPKPTNSLLLHLHTFQFRYVPPWFKKNHKSGCKYCTTHSSIRSFARTAHSFTCSALLALHALTHSLTRSIRSLPGKVHD